MNAEILTCDPLINLSGKALKIDCKVALVNLTHDGFNSYGVIEDKFNLKYKPYESILERYEKVYQCLKRVVDHLDLMNKVLKFSGPL